MSLDLTIIACTSHVTNCDEKGCILCSPMKEKYYDLAYTEARNKAADLLAKLKRHEQLEKIYSKFEATPDQAARTDFAFHC